MLRQTNFRPGIVPKELPTRTPFTELDPMTTFHANAAATEVSRTTPPVATLQCHEEQLAAKQRGAQSVNTVQSAVVGGF